MPHKTIIPSRNLRNLLSTIASVLFLIPCQAQLQKPAQTIVSKGLIGYWPFSADINDKSGNDWQTLMHGKVQLNKSEEKPDDTPGARFDGRTAWLEATPGATVNMGNGDFSIAAWINTDKVTDDVFGDLISQYDPATRRGFHLGLKYNFGPTNTGNFRQLYFGVDNQYASDWKDYGRPGNNIFPFALVSYNGSLYAATCDSSARGRGHVYRYTGDTTWVDCGFIDSSNAVTSLTVFNGDLYASTGHYRIGGSALAASENKIFGGRIFRFDPPNKWIDCGRVPVESVAGMIVYKGNLYATSMYNRPGFFRYKGGKEWETCDVPDKRLNAMGIHNGYLYATSYDWGHVYRYDGYTWTDCGQVGDEKVNTQCYGFATYEGKLYVSTWASGRVYRFDGINQWTDVGRLGSELEVMGLIVHNGRLLGGTLPLAEIYSYEGDTTWQRMEQLDRTPDVKYRRAWSMAEHDGKVFCGTLPSGSVYGFEAGKSVLSPEELPAGWQHVVAVKAKGFLKLYVNGKMVNTTKIPSEMKIEPDARRPIKIGFGPNEYFNGAMKEVRLYYRVLKDKEIKLLSAR